MEVTEVETYIKDHFPNGFLVLPPGDSVQFVANPGRVWEQDGETWMVVWPNQYKELHLRVGGQLEESSKGWIVEGPEGRTELRPLGDEYKGGIFK